MKGDYIMIDIKECLKRYKTNPFLLKRSIDFELSKHGKDVCVCTSSFTQFMEERGLGKAPITTDELLELKKAL